MGVPKFYRWLSERYPCLSQVIKEHQIPEFDNLYLDMNGIIHPCSHPNDDDPHFRITEAQIFKNIFNYIEVLVRIIKPKQNFFMAVDGCAPRAKMNQQRSRRFRTAKEAEDNIRKALLKGQTLPKEERFDSNCITPGTEFMARLQTQLKYFVNKKISTDPLWQNVNVYLSGHDVPGEGEHKVMDFIRYCKSKPGYDPNTRHCLYGLDADLIMLGLTAHEPHFALLREEVRFGKQAKRMTRPEEQTFHLLHLSLLREYIDFEFSILKSSMHFTYDLERLIDDWILLGFLVGNDFVPHLPHMHINHDALPYLFEVYKEFICATDGYINDGGHINLLRLKKFFELLSKFDRDRFDEIYADLKWLESKGAGKLLEDGKKKTFSKFLVSLDADEVTPSPVKQNRFAELQNMSGALEDFSDSPQKPVKILTKNNQSVLFEDDVDDDDDDVEIEDEETFELEFKQHKRHYYMEKFDMDIVDDDQVKTICYEYVRALQWIAHYYFNGLQSWSWYYPYHYAPYISDVANLELRELHYDMAKPFHPFEQLLAVLPAASRKLLPTAFQHLMIMDNSPIIDFYPSEFRTDLNGKQQEWEAVVLIPFIDEDRLMDAMRPNYSHLTDEEKERNAFGKCSKYTYDKTLNFVYQSAFPEHFPDITICRAKLEEHDREHFHLSVGVLKKGLLEGTKLDVYFHGFPTMKHIKHQAYLKKAGVKVFQQNSRNDNTIIKILAGQPPSIEEIAKSLVGETSFVEWPYMVEALITSVCNDSIRYYLDHNNQLTSEMLGGEKYKSVKREMKAISTYHMERKGVELGEVKVLVEAKLLLGQRYICGQKGKVTLEKEWSPRSNFYGYKVVVKDLSVHVEHNEVFESIETLYTPGTPVFMMASPHYGSSGEVIECDRAAGRVRVALKVIPEPNYADIIQKYDSLSVHYISDRAVAQRLGMSTQLLGRITGDVRITEQNITGSRFPPTLANIGLKLKYSGQNKEVLGFARRSTQGWTYSPATISILQAYMEQFPDVFEALGRRSNHDNYIFFEMFPKRGKNYLDEITQFLKEQPCFKAQPVRCGSTTLDEPVVLQIENCIEELSQSSKDQNKIVKVKLKPHLLFRPTEQFGKLTPDPATQFLLFDRIVNVQNGITVPVGLRGTIIGIHEVLTVEKDKDSPTETRYEVLFDEPFLGGVIARSKEKRGYFMGGNSLINISYGERKNLEKKGIPLPSPMSFQSKITQTSSNNDQDSSSPYSQKRPGIIHTPTRVLNNSNRKQTPTSDKRSYSSNKDDNLVSPDYWLKGSYNKSNQSSPSQQFQPQNRTPSQQFQPQNRTPTQQQQNSTPKMQGGSPFAGQQMGDNNDFMNMWKEMQKAEQQQQAVQGSFQDQNAAATATLHKMLHIQSPNTSQSPASSQRSAGSQYDSPHGQYQQKGSNSPKQQSTSLALQHLCAQAKLPLPQYAYSKTKQGVSALVMIGHQYRFGGTICSTQQQAADSAAAVALTQIPQLAKGPVQVVPVISPVQLTSQFFPITPVPVGIQLHQPFQQQNINQAKPRQLYQSPKGFATGVRPSYQQHQGIRHSSPRYNQPAEGQRQYSHPQKSKSDQVISSPVDKKNPFVPHQVMVKGKPSSSAPNLSTTSLGLTSSFQQQEQSPTESQSNQLRDMLGIHTRNQDEELKDLIGVPPPKSRDEQLMDLIGVSSKDQQLKDLIGVEQPSPSSVVHNTDDTLKQLIGVGKQEEENQDNILKNLLGVNQPQFTNFNSVNQAQSQYSSFGTTQQQALLRTSQPAVELENNDNKLKELLGLTSAINIKDDAHVDDEDDILARPLEKSPTNVTNVQIDNNAMTDALMTMLMTNTMSSNNIETPNQKQLPPQPTLQPIVLPQTDHVTSSSSSPKPAIVSPPQEDTTTRKKKQILLAPSFFGPKKK